MSQINKCSYFKNDYLRHFKKLEVTKKKPVIFSSILKKNGLRSNDFKEN